MLRLIHLLLQTVLVLVVYFVLAVRANVQAWPRLLLVYFFPAPLLPPLILVERVATVTAWAVTEAASCFIIALILLSSLLVPVATVLAAYSVVLVRKVWPSTLASSSMMHSACELEFSLNAVA